MNSQRLSLHIVIAVLSSVMLVLLGASAAHADPASREEGSITIHKLQNIVGGGTTTGVEDRTIDFAEHPPLSGVTFIIQQIEGVDFSVVDGWNALEPKVAAFTPGDPADGYGLGTLGGATSFVTSASGLAVFANLSTGAYLVRETAGSSAPVDPFIVTVPMAHPHDPATWNHDVHVYPQGQVVKAEMLISGDDAALSVENIGQQTDFVPFFMDRGTILVTGVGMLLALLSMIALAHSRVVTNT